LGKGELVALERFELMARNNIPRAEFLKMR